MVDSSRRRLEIFCYVASSKSIGEAADHFGISQPSVSAHIRALEAQARTPLFTRRKGRSVVLSGAGEVVLEYARSIIDLSDRVGSKLNEFRGEASVVRVGAQRILAARLLPAIISKYAKRYPAAGVSLNSETQEVVGELLLKRKIDVAILFSDLKHEALNSIEIGRQKLAFVASPDHPLASKKKISIAELSRARFVEGLKNSTFVIQLRATLKEFGFEPVGTFLNLQDAAAIRFAVADGLGISCSFLLNIADDLEQGRLVILDVDCPEITVPILAVTHAGQPATPVRRFLEVLQESGSETSSIPKSHSPIAMGE